MNKRFHLLKQREQESILKKMELLSGRGWHLESFNVSVENNTPVFYALMSSTDDEALESMAISEELEGLPVVSNSETEKGKYQQ